MFQKSALALVTALAFGIANADTLLIEGVEMAESNSTERPARGQTKERVEERFGTPSEMVAAIGDPPISRWVYPTFTVYFEYDHVVHAVPRR